MTETWQDTETMRLALLHLRNEVRGMLGAFELALRETLGNSNVTALQLRVEEATTALDGLEHPWIRAEGDCSQSS